MRRQCEGHGEGCLWLLLRSLTQEVTSDMKFTDCEGHFKIGCVRDFKLMFQQF